MHRNQSFRMAELLFPRQCPVCQEVLPVLGTEIVTKKNAYLCRECYEILPFVGEITCYQCGKTLSDEEAEYCQDCSENNHSFKKNVAILEYKGQARACMAALKYKNRRDYAEFFAEELVRRYGDEITNWGIEAILPVPVHARKRRVRGYNQAEILAKEIGRRMKLPVYSGLLVRTKYTKPQKNLTGLERGNNVKNAFLVTEDRVKLKKVMMVDDIYTSGATIDECSVTLQQHGVEKVYAACICIGRGF